MSLRRLPAAVRELRRKGDGSEGQISSVQALASTIGATVGLGSIAGVAIALVLGGPGAIFWMWVSAIVGMCTKYHEGVLTTMFKGTDDRGIPQGGTMHIIERGLGPKWKPLAVFFAVAGMFGTLCIINANQLTEAFMSTFSTPESIEANGLLSTVGNALGLPNAQAYKLLFGSTVCAIVALVIYGGIGRIARVASILVPFMVGLYFVMVLYIIVSNIHGVPAVVGRIFSEAFNLRAGFGAFVGIAIIGARRAALRRPFQGVRQLFRRQRRPASDPALQQGQQQGAAAAALPLLRQAVRRGAAAIPVVDLDRFQHLVQGDHLPQARLAAPVQHRLVKGLFLRRPVQKLQQRLPPDQAVRQARQQQGPFLLDAPVEEIVDILKVIVKRLPPETAPLRQFPDPDLVQGLFPQQLPQGAAQLPSGSVLIFRHKLLLSAGIGCPARLNDSLSFRLKLRFFAALSILYGLLPVKIPLFFIFPTPSTNSDNLCPECCV